MEQKINIAELLKDCPKSMELNCTIYDNVEFEGISDNKDWPIKISVEGYPEVLNPYGCISYRDYTKCVIFPKGKTTWEGFVPPCQFKDGDIIFTHANCLKAGVGNTWISIFKERRNGGVATYVDYAEDGSDYYSDLDGDKALLCMESDILRQRFATEKEKEELFKVIKDNGYEWNAETKTLKKLIKLNFKDGDIVYIKTNVFEHIFIFKVNKDDNFIEGYASLSDSSLYLDGYPVCETNDVKEIRLATEQEKEKLFDALKPTGYHWNSETKTLEYLIKPKFKPGDKIRSKNKKDEYFHILHVDEDKHKYVLNIKGYCLEFKDQDNYELVSDTSIEPKFKVGDKVRRKNNHNLVFTITSIEEDSYGCGANLALWFDDQDKYELIPNKFDINTLKPFDKVLVRDIDKGRWDIHFYEGYDNENKTYPYRTLGGMVYKQCIPYEGNEHLIGLVKECDDYYKTWINEES